MEIEKKGVDKDAVLLSVKGRIDERTARQFDKQMAELINNGGSCFIVNLSEVDYINSAGLRSILISSKKLQLKAGRIFLANLQESVKQVFQISGFDSIIPIFDSMEDALAVL